MAKKWEDVQCTLHPDKTGIVWDLILYVPTVMFLLLWGLKLWFSGTETQGWMAYGLLFLGFFFLIAGGNRIGKRLLLLPSAPVALDITPERIKINLKGGDKVTLIKDLRFFSDMAGKSFGLTGMDNRGAKQQFVLYAKQFNQNEYDKVKKALERYA